MLWKECYSSLQTYHIVVIRQDGGHQGSIIIAIFHVNGRSLTQQIFHDGQLALSSSNMQKGAAIKVSGK